MAIFCRGLGQKTSSFSLRPRKKGRDFTPKDYGQRERVLLIGPIEGKGGGCMKVNL